MSIIISFFRQTRQNANSTARTQVSDLATMSNKSVESTREASVTDTAPSVGDQLKMNDTDRNELPVQVNSMAAEMRNFHYALRQLQEHQDQVPSMFKSIDKRLVNIQHSMQSVRSPEEAEANKIKIMSLEQKLKQANANADEAMKRWKKAASKVNLQPSQTNAPDQLSDSDLISLAMQLRYKIRTFSAQFFSGSMSSRSQELPRGNYSKYMFNVAKTGADQYLPLLMSESKGSFMVQSFLWRVLHQEVFGCYLWAPQLRCAIDSLGRASKEVDEKRGAADTEREFHIWRSTTASQALRWMESVERVARTNSAVISCSENIYTVIGPFSRVSDNQFVMEGICDILDAAISLDQRICTQVALINWYFPSQLDPFRADTMKVELGAPNARPEELVDIVTAPALMKVTHTRHSLKPQNCLLESDVVCAPSSSSTRPHADRNYPEPKPLHKSNRLRSLRVVEASGGSDQAK
ncbi:hypothetical protein F4678DRAFT_437014 [Xylaria arbuscula]|nr:hypothetical protein F4678DRAFT_437014 [Xylaria arbuscula]